MGLFDAIKNKVAGFSRNISNKAELKAYLEEALSDGKLTEEEIEIFEEKMQTMGLSQDDIKSYRAQMYAQALAVAKSDGKVTAEEEAELRKIQQVLGIQDAEIATSKQDLRRMRLLADIQDGHLPSTLVNGLVLQRGEQVYWAESGWILQEVVVSRQYESGSRGVNFRIAKGINYRVGQTKGRMVSEKEVQKVSTGQFVITNKRLIFKGEPKAFNLRMAQIVDLQFYTDGLRITADTANPRVVKFATPANIEIVCAVLSKAVNGYQD